jgi:hypothetical protein
LASIIFTAAEEKISIAKYCIPEANARDQKIGADLTRTKKKKNSAGRLLGEWQISPLQRTKYSSIYIHFIICHRKREFDL